MDQNRNLKYIRKNHTPTYHLSNIDTYKSAKRHFEKKLLGEMLV